MLVRARRAWWLPERQATPESSFVARRALLRGIAAAGVAALAPGSAPGAPSDAASPAPGHGAPYPAPRNPRYVLDRPLTAEAVAGSSNIFDEMSAERDGVARAARGLVTSPWTVHVGGLVGASRTFDVDELVRRLGVEERLYRHRCVEAWSMAVPWTGFPLRKLVELVQPLQKARFVRLVGLVRPEQAPAWNASRRVFPYYEALSLPEAMNDLAFVVTGVYGHALPVQHGAPLRLAVPWKYGFKSIKSITAFQFTEQRPGTFWNELSPGNYSWQANVDPTETHPWPQNEETVLGTDLKRPTQPFNGYGAMVAGLYA